MDKQTCFVIMPFSEPFDSNYENVIKPTIIQSGLTPIRGDEIFSANAIMEDIWKNIATCRLLVAELTGQNPNVYYELGIAHTLDKPVILLIQKGEKLPFDISAIRAITYDTTESDWMEQFAKILKKTIASLLQGSGHERPYWKKYQTKKDKALRSLPQLKLEKTHAAFSDAIYSLTENQLALFRVILSKGFNGIYFDELINYFPNQTRGELVYRCKELVMVGLIEDKIATEPKLIVPEKIISLTMNFDFDNRPIIKGRPPI
jgi:hypothetical protein